MATRDQLNGGPSLHTGRLTLLGLVLLGCTGLATAPGPIGGPASTPPMPTSTTPSPLTTVAQHATVPTTTPTMITREPPPGSCRPDPFSGSVPADLSGRYPGRDITAHAYDIGTGCEYSLNARNRQRTASVFKVMVMAGTLLEAQLDGRTITELEAARLSPMITRSANSPVRELWRSFGGSPWFGEIGLIFGLSETTITADGGTAWGATRTSAADQVDLLRQVLLGEGELLDESSRQTAFDLMTSVVPEQTWGVTAGVPGSWTVAQKNGFAGRIINSVGWVDPPGARDGYIVAILTDGWPTHAAGIAAVEHISVLVADALIDTVPGAR